jgi:hypothetical protein
MTTEHKPSSSPSATPEQLKWLYEHRSDVQAVKIGLGSNGYPAPEDGWVLLKSGKSVWLSPKGEAQPT